MADCPNKPQARARERQSTERRPVQGNTTARSDRSAGIDACSGAFATFFSCLTPFANTGISEDLSVRF